ncbi:hypothetical protein [Haloarchaeobius sp. FL176]|uniref:hypothetical protein n=1 Tax=Haloarchaeobius sp. FL176 TaxID=2967129 RepID=UPI002147CC83|nr:hypothetical protein [Haloarchaeobius sp. FL176]
MSHPTTIGHALWDALRTFYRDFRRAVATKQEHSGPALVVSGDFDEVQAALGRQHFAPNWEFSYNKRGEDLNLARITYERREVGHHEYGWWQTHVRGWAQDNGSMRLRAHWELEPTENDQDHIDGIGLDVPAGVDQTARALDAEDVAYQRYDNLPAGGE